MFNKISSYNRHLSGNWMVEAAVGQPEQIPQFTNFNLQDVVTPVDVSELERLLRVSCYDGVETEFLIQGFSKGFMIGYRSEN